ncbi:hypothetical protein J0383_21190 [Flavobacterium endoglycinae]|uniref:Entericidin n=1 Tax=Flavobacterium endoglycinae TaxID=2816357 RepID=A0ABX7QDS7_9FLAO|nr:hypothetical protein [Flavobacterium endoglycinae]QSW88741.1 hypothetical protein J0383_21190 [Flavobacterium endoglycinae]
MKTLLKTKIALLLVLAGLAFSCKKNETTNSDSYENDSISNTVDTVGPEVDTTTVIDTAATKINTDSIKK